MKDKLKIGNDTEVAGKMISFEPGSSCESLTFAEFSGILNTIKIETEGRIYTFKDCSFSINIKSFDYSVECNKKLIKERDYEESKEC